MLNGPAEEVERVVVRAKESKLHAAIVSGRQTACAEALFLAGTKPGPGAVRVDCQPRFTGSKCASGYCDRLIEHPTGAQDRLLDGQIMRIRKIRFLFAANDPGHVGGVGDVASEFGQRNVVR